MFCTATEHYFNKHKKRSAGIDNPQTALHLRFQRTKCVAMTN